MTTVTSPNASLTAKTDDTFDTSNKSKSDKTGTQKFRSRLPPKISDHMKVLQVFCALSNLLLFALGIACTCIASYYFLQFNDLLAGIPDINQGQYMTFSEAMAPFYTLLILGIFITIVGFSGFCGAAYMDTCYMNVYIFMLTFLIISFIAGFVANIHYKEDFDNAMNKLFSQFEVNMYGLTGAVIQFFVTLLENMHTSHRCCGFYEIVSNISASHMVVLYWMENTHWGQVSALEGQFKANSSVEWVPRSCCKVSGCNRKKYNYTDRLRWNEDLDLYWDQAINTDSCAGRAMHLSQVSDSERTKYLAVLIGACVLVGILWLLALIFKCEIHRYERNMKDHLKERRMDKYKIHAKPKKVSPEKSAVSVPTFPSPPPPPLYAPPPQHLYAPSQTPYAPPLDPYAPPLDPYAPTPQIYAQPPPNYAAQHERLPPPGIPSPDSNDTSQKSSKGSLKDT